MSEQTVAGQAVESAAPVSAPADTQQAQPQTSEGITRENVLAMAPFLRENRTTEQSDAPTPESQALDRLMNTGEQPTEQEPVTSTQGKAAEEKPVEQPQQSIIKLPDGTELTYEELQKSLLRQADYTRKTQQIAEQRRQLEAQLQEAQRLREQVAQPMQLWEAMQRDPIGTIEYLREQYSQMGILEPRDPAEIQQEIARQQLERERQQINQEKYQINMQKAESEINSYLSDLSQRYSDFDPVEVLDYAVANKIADPEVAYKALTRDKVEQTKQQQIAELEAKLAQAKQEGVREYLTNKTKQNASSPPLGASGVVASPPIVPERIRSFDEARASAIRRANQQDQK